MPSKVKCDYCRGTGKKSVNETKTCNVCYGRKTYYPHTRNCCCRTCNGNGTIRYTGNKDCSTCGGKGYKTSYW